MDYQNEVPKLKAELDTKGYLVLLTDDIDGQALVTQLANTGEYQSVAVFGNSYMQTMHYCHSWLKQDRVLLNRWPQRSHRGQALVVISGAFDNEETLARFLMARELGHKVIVEGRTGPHFHKDDWYDRGYYTYA